VGEVKYDPTALAGLIPKGRTSVEVAGVLQAMLEQAIDPLLEWNAATVETAIKEHVAVCGWAPKELFMTVRFAATGRAATPPLFETLAVLGKEVCRRRLRAAAEALRTQK